MDTFADNEKKVIDFIGEVEKERAAKREDDDFRNSNFFKLKLLNASRDKMHDHCCHHICKSIYRDAIPLGDVYKQGHIADIDDEFEKFIASRCPEGLSFYIKEALRKGSPFAKKLVECVTNIVNEAYFDKEMNVEDYGPEDLEFDPKKDAEDEKLDLVADDLSAKEISQQLYDITKKTAVDEIERAKAEKEKLRHLHDELSNDINMNSRAAVESALEIAGVTNNKFYTPSLFEGINIGKLNTLRPKFESGELATELLYDALAPYRESEEVKTETTEVQDPVYATLEELAFIESVEEYTGLMMAKALKLETFTLNDVNNLASKYAEMR